MELNNSFLKDVKKFRYDEKDLITVIQSVIFENLGLSDVLPSLHFFKDLKMDEATKVEILLAIEHAIGFKIDEKSLYAVNSINDAVSLYKELLSEVLEKDDCVVFADYNEKC